MARRGRPSKESKAAKQLQVIDTSNLLMEYDLELETNPVFSLVADPTGHYGFTKEEQEFMRHYVETRNLALSSELAGLQYNQAMEIFRSYAFQEEFKRINRALYHRQFKNKILSMEEIGRWLSAMITDNNVAAVDRLNSSEKLKAIKLLSDLHIEHLKAFTQPGNVMQKDFESQVKDLSIDAIKALLNQENASVEKNAKIKEINKLGVLSAEEEAYLKTLSLEEILQILEETS